MKYDKWFNSNDYRYSIRKIRKRFLGKYRQRRLRQLLKDISFTIQNSDYKKTFHYGRDYVRNYIKRERNK